MSVTYTFTGGTTAASDEVNNNFLDLSTLASLGMTSFLNPDYGLRSTDDNFGKKIMSWNTMIGSEHIASFSSNMRYDVGVDTFVKYPILYINGSETSGTITTSVRTIGVDIGSGAVFSDWIGIKQMDDLTNGDDWVGDLTPSGGSLIASGDGSAYYSGSDFTGLNISVHALYYKKQFSKLRFSDDDAPPNFVDILGNGIGNAGGYVVVDLTKEGSWTAYLNGAQVTSGTTAALTNNKIYIQVLSDNSDADKPRLYFLGYTQGDHAGSSASSVVGSVRLDQSTWNPITTERLSYFSNAGSDFELKLDFTKGADEILFFRGYSFIYV